VSIPIDVDAAVERVLLFFQENGPRGKVSDQPVGRRNNWIHNPSIGAHITEKDSTAFTKFTPPVYNF